MPDKNYTQIPSLDLSHFSSVDQSLKREFVNNLGEAFNNLGFVAIKNHGLTDDLTKNLYKSVEAFFALGDEVKQKYEIPSLFGQRGYVGKNKETGKGHSVPDLKEFYHIGQEVPEEVRRKMNYPENIFPKEVPEMMEYGIMAYRLLENAGKQILRAIAIYLNLNENYFDEKVTYGDSILRSIHYFPINDPDKISPEAVRAAAHGDINLITLLMGASAEGLQILKRDGTWISVTALPEQIVVNVGDMLDRLTNNKLKSTIHRVVNPPQELMHTSRFSIPFFMHSRADTNLTCLSSCIDDEHPKLYSDMTAGAFLEERLIELGLKKK